MPRWIVSLVIAVSALTAFVAADPPSCSPSRNCPSDSPCCSRTPLFNLHANCRIRSLWYRLDINLHMSNLIGIGSYCLGGCDPRFSFSIDSCMPAPQCQNRKYTFENVTSALTDYTTYLGDSNSTAWTYSGYPLQYGSNMLMTMPANSAGTVIMSTQYVWYGKISATLKTSRDQGVVTAYM